MERCDFIRQLLKRTGIGAGIAFREPFIGWAKRSGGCVAELHAYAIAPG
jgi:hypothetical protein